MLLAAGERGACATNQDAVLRLIWFFNSGENNVNTTYDFGDGRGPVPAHQHTNPDGNLGGWVDDTAKVASGVTILLGASIGYLASIGYRASIGDRASIGYLASIGDRARIGDRASIGYLASIGDRARISREGIVGYTPKLPVPIVPEIDSAILAALESGGRLEMYSYHQCETTHCRAGWAVTLAGDAGKALEMECGSWLAGALIYQASRPGQRIPDFYAKDQDALADIRECAKTPPQTDAENNQRDLQAASLP